VKAAVKGLFKIEAAKFKRFQQTIFIRSLFSKNAAEQYNPFFAQPKPIQYGHNLPKHIHTNYFAK
jgi:hypothetical protein